MRERVRRFSDSASDGWSVSDVAMFEVLRVDNHFTDLCVFLNQSKFDCRLYLSGTRSNCSMSTWDFLASRNLPTYVWAHFASLLCHVSATELYSIRYSIACVFQHLWTVVNGALEIWLHCTGLCLCFQILCDAVVLYTDTVVTMLENNGFYDFEDEQMTSQKSSV